MEGEVEFPVRSLFGHKESHDIKGDYGIVRVSVRRLHYYGMLESMEMFKRCDGL